MTGRDLIIYILENGLEEVEVGKLIFQTPAFLSIFDAAKKFNVGEATISAWVQSGQLKAFVVNGELRIPSDATVERDIMQ